MMHKKLVHFISSLHYGGAEQILVDVIEGLKQYKYEHMVLYIHDGPQRKILEEDGISCHQIKGLWCSYDPIFFIRLWRMLRALRPDLIHSSLWAANWSGRLLARWLKIPIIHAYHNRAQLDGRVRNLLDRITHAHMVPALTPLAATADSLRLKKIVPAQVSVIPHGINQERLRMRAIDHGYTRKALSLPESDVIIGMVARFIPEKNHSLLLKALAYLVTTNPDLRWHVLLLGTGDTRDVVHTSAALGLSSRITFIHDQPSWCFIALFNCFVLPSLSEGGTPLALQEAMAMAIPVIISHHANGQALIQPSINGLLCSTDDEKELAHYIIDLIKSPDYARTLGQAGKKTIEEHYPLHVMIQGYHHIFENMLSQNMHKQ